MDHVSVASISNSADLGVLSSMCYLIGNYTEYPWRCLEFFLVAYLIGSASSNLIVDKLGTWFKAKEGKKKTSTKASRPATVLAQPTMRRISSCVALKDCLYQKNPPT